MIRFRGDVSISAWELIARSLRRLVRRANVEVDVQAVNAGLGVIAAVGAERRADSFVSFDRKAVVRLEAIGMSAELVDA